MPYLHTRSTQAFAVYLACLSKTLAYLSNIQSFAMLGEISRLQGRTSCDCCNYCILGWMPFLTPSQHCQSTEGIQKKTDNAILTKYLQNVYATYAYN